MPSKKIFSNHTILENIQTSAESCDKMLFSDVGIRKEHCHRGRTAVIGIHSQTLCFFAMLVNAFWAKWVKRHPCALFILFMSQCVDSNVFC